MQTQNQRALLFELQNLLRTVHVDHEALTTLTQESLEKSQSIHLLEEAAAQLYKALQAGRDTGNILDPRKHQPNEFDHRYGRHYGTASRVSNIQCTILQANV